MTQRITGLVLGVAISLNGGNAFAAVGRTVGQFQVSSTGSAQYSIPIWAPPGPRGMQPNISLFYDSQSSIGPVGAGWSIAGLGQITRCNKTVAQDTTAAPVALVTTDGYCINGNRLRLTSGTYGTAGSVYQTEIADFSQITAVGTAGNGPASFTVQGRNGLTYYYGYVDPNGNGVNSQVLANGTSTALTWLLSKVVDRAGNNYVINCTTLSGTLIGTAVPSTILWTPTTAGGSSYAYTMQFNYSSNVAQSSVNRYVGGTNVYNPKLLTSIEILYGSSTVVKDYALGYTPSPTTGRNQITSVTECQTAGSNCLSPTSISYGGPAKGVSSTSNSALSSSGTNLTARYDLNGDGIPDLVYYSGGTWYVAFGSASGYAAPISTTITAAPLGFLLGNLNGGSEDGILANKGGTWYYYTWNGTAFEGTSTGLTYDSTALSYQLADVDGDGLPDLVSLYVTPNVSLTVDVRKNTTSGVSVLFNSTAYAAYTQSGAISTAGLQTPDQQNQQYGKLRRYDFNGDGRDDLALQVIKSAATIYTYELISNGFSSSMAATVISEQAVDLSFTPFFVDLNDDKCTDYIIGNLSGSSTIYVAGCNGSIAKTYSVSGTLLTVMDWDGDGRTDVVVANGSTIGAYLSTGNGISSTITTSSVPYASGACQYIAMDATGGGLDDLGCLSGSGALHYYLHNGVPDLVTKIEDGYGNSVSPTYVSMAQGDYTTYQYASPSYPYADYLAPLYLVNKATFSDPSTTAGTYYLTYSYSGAWINLQGRGFSNFLEIQKFDSRNELWETDWRSSEFPWAGMLTGVGVSQDQALTKHISAWSINDETYITLDGTTNNQRYFPYYGTKTTNGYEVGGAENGDLITTATTNYTYDNYGNALTVDTTITDNDPGSPYNGDTWTTNITNTPDVDTAHWCLGLFTETQVAYSATPASIGAAVTRTKTFTPDTTNCRYTQLVTEPTANSGLYKVTEALTFDAFGNVATDTVTGANMPSSPASREIQMNWGTTGQFPNSLTDPSGAVTTWAYTSNSALTFGVPDSKKDANSLTTSWTYDAFGRKTKETRPDGTSSGWAWSLCSSYCGWSNSVYQIAQTAYQTNGTTVIRTDTNSYDPVDRVTQTAGPTVAGNTSTVQRLYNSLGLLYQQSMPFLNGSPAYEQTYAYDALNRPTSVTRPISSTNSNPQTTNFGYAGRTTTATDPYGDVKTSVTDVNGWLRQAKDALGYTVTRAYDSAGSLTGITDSVGNTLLKNVTVVYGIKPFVTAATDADRGAWTYTIDSLGEKTAWTDAKGQSFSMSFDALSRPLSRTEPDLFTEWQYGSAAPNWGHLTAECTQSASTTNLCTTTGSSWLYDETRTYDSLSRPSTRSITESGNTAGNDGGGAFLYTHAYSATTGLLNTLTYPTSTSSFALTLQYGYGSGLLQSITDTSDTTATCGTTCVLWTANAQNGFGEVTQETFGNGVVSNRSYDAVTSWLTAATAGGGGGSAILNQSYLEDENGNITQRQDNNLGLTESFFYDKDNRLTCASLSSTCSTPTFVYDGGSAGPGNITTQTGVGTYTYPAAGQPRPHAVASITGTFNGITNPTFSYDANGNMTDRASSSTNVTWFSNNYPASISATDPTGSEEVQFQYGPDRKRWQGIYTGSAGPKTSYYVGKPLEVVFTGGVTYYRQYIYAGSRPVAVYIRNSSAVNTMSYLSMDHEGSISAITINTGAVGADESFTAFGARRNSSTWSGAPTGGNMSAIEIYTRQGYTFQTWLGETMGLNHMNGRVEDAIMGRMLSPDPHVPDRANAQSYNRYSYVNNNPLTLADPSGFIPGGICSRPGVCPADLDHAGEGGIATLSDGSFEGFTGTGLGDFGYLGDGYDEAQEAALQAVSSWSPLDGYSIGGPQIVPGPDASTVSAGAAQTPALPQSEISTAPSADGTPAILVTATPTGSSPLTESPLLAQEFMLGAGNDFLDTPAGEALRSGRFPTPAESAASQPKYGTQTGTPPQEPATDPSMSPAGAPGVNQGVPNGGFWLQFFYLAGKYWNSFWGVSPAVSVCPLPTCQA